jgi:aryl-alcohol dehydrogenase-like predicted oxidoreductase
MEYRVLGGTGVRVSTHCLGAMMFGPTGNEDPEECVRIIHAALDGGINFIDTADVYSRGVSEEIVGRALLGRRDDVVLATKVHGRMGQGINQSGNSRLWITREVEASLRRLGTDHIDLYQLHRPDPRTDLEESLEAMTDLIRQGKVRYAGTSAFPAWQIVEAHWTSERRGLARFRCEQSSYSILVRERELDVFPVAQRYGMGVIAYSPLAGGMLSGKYRRGQDPAPDSRIGRAQREGRLLERYDFGRPEVQRKLEVAERLGGIADDAGVRLTHLAVAFVLAHPAITAAIVGPRTMDHLEDLLKGAETRLDGPILDALDEVVTPGEVVDTADRGWDPPWLEPSARRRS